MRTSDIVNESAVIALSASQREILADLLEKERSHASKWWSYLNEMRLRGELPDWVKTQGIGSHTNYDQMEETRIAFNSALFGKREHIRTEGEPVFVTISIDGA
ncbi:hypothetical protein PS910_02700 [Pseudomonas fluorescens]|nr:hypothetical protein PS910_02700 [Pseudomonas fluorescens]